MSSLLDTINQFNAYVSHDIDEAELKKYMEFYAKNTKARMTDFYLTSIDNDPELETAIKILLKKLHISKRKWELYFNNNYSFYDFLVEVNKAHNKKTDLEIELFIELIEKKDRTYTRALIINLVLLVIAAVLLLAFFPPIVGLFRELLPLLGLFYSVASASYSFTQSYYDKKKVLFATLRDGGFLFASTALNIAAYAFWIVSAAPITPLIAGLFVAASAVSVVKDVFYAIQIYMQYTSRPASKLTDSLDDRQISVRLEYGFIRHRNAAMINFSVSLVLLGLMTVWCFVPGGTFFIIGVIASIMVVQFMNSQLNKWNDVRIREQLANELTSIEDEFIKTEGEELEDINDIEFSPALSVNRGEQSELQLETNDPPAQEAETTISRWCSFFASEISSDQPNATVVSEDNQMGSASELGLGR